MAGNAVIGALRIVLGADSAELETGLKKASKKLDEFAASAANAARLAAASFTLAAAGLAVAIKGTINEADKLYKMSQSFGVPIEELSKLKHAADLSGVSLESLGKSVGKLSRNMMEAAANPTGEAAKAFDALKIKVQNADGTLKSSSQVISEIAGKFVNMKDGAGKTALAIALFGRAGADMIPMLNQGKSGIQEMMAEAEKLGIVFDKRTGAAAEAFNDNLTRMRKVFDAVVIKVTAEMLPALLQFSKMLLDASKNSSLLKIAAETIISVFRGAVTAVITASFVFQRLVAEIGALVEVVKTTAPVLADFFGGIASMNGALIARAALQIGAVKAAVANFGKTIADTEEGRKKLADWVAEFYKNATVGADDLARRKPPPNDAPIIEGNKNAIDKYIDSLKKRNATLQAELETIGLSESAHAARRIQLEAEAIAEANKLKITKEMQAALDAQKASTASLTDSIAAAKERWEEFRGAVLQVRSSLESAFTDAITQAKSFKDVIKSLIGDLARLAAQSAFRSLFGGQLDWTNLASSMFSGGNVSAKSGGLMGFATGGSFKVGGTGGIDSQLVAFRASPNERVSITKPGQDMGSGMNFSFAPIYNVQGSGPEIDRLRADMARDRATFESRTIMAVRRANHSNMKLS